MSADAVTEGRPSRLRVLQVVALVSAAGAYGGPTTVALGQLKALLDLGHEPVLLAGWDGRAARPAGVPVALCRARMLTRRSFASLVSPSLVLWFLRHRREFDVAHIHLARDLLSLPVAALALLLRVPLVVQTHGMVVPDRRWAVRLLDLLTRPVLKGAATVVALTPLEAEQLGELGVPRDRIALLGNAVEVPQAVAGYVAQAPLVVFLSRLAARKRPASFVQMAERAVASRPDTRFEIWGPDEGELRHVLAEIDGRRASSFCTYRGVAAPGDAPAVLVKAQVLVLPSVSEPMPMVVLEAMSLGLPAVITDDTGLSDRLSAAGAAVVTDGSPRAMAAAVVELLNDENKWQEVSRAARALAAQEFSPSALARKLTQHYVGATGGTDR